VDEHTYGVAELGRAVGQAVEGAFPAEVWVRGEIHNLQRRSSGHVYFDLLDPDQPGDASLPVVLFDSSRRAVNVHLQRSGAGRMEDGTDVRIRGFLGYYAPQGRIQLRMTRIDADYTLGKLAADRARLLHRLAADGLLDANARLPVPVVPLRVGLVTSVGSAAATDFLTELQASGFGWSVIEADARVQGAGAERSIVAGLAAAAAAGADVVALVRGGGARTDLAAFDGEDLARAIAAAPVPVFTGIGHEIDDTVADRVSHTAYKTPTACAAALVAAVSDYVTAAEAAWAGVRQTAAGVGRAARDRIDAGSRRLLRSTTGAVALSRLATAEAERRLLLAAGRVVEQASAATGSRADRLVLAGRRVPAAALREIDGAAARVRALDPARILARGWSITRSDDGAVLRSVAGLAGGSPIVTTLADGEVSSRVESVRQHGNDEQEQPDAE
jgi:exodeoxyribonuclease VII large subunit